MTKYYASGSGIYQRPDGGKMGFLIGRVEDHVTSDDGTSPAEFIAKALNAIESDPLSLGQVQERIDAVYLERNRLVALLARIYPSGIGRTDIEGWDPEWHNVVYIDSPMGQLSWHFHDRDAWMFSDLDFYPGTWDGHSTELKHERIHSLFRQADMHRMAAGDRTYLKKGLQYRQDDAIHAIGLAAVAKALEEPAARSDTHPPLREGCAGWLAGTDDASSSSDT